MLLLLLAGLILCIMFFHYKSKKKFTDLPGAGLQLPLIGHYQVSCPLIGHYQVSCPLIGWPYSVHNALPLQIQEEVYRPSWGWPSAASLGHYQVSCPLIGHYQVSCPLIGWPYSVHNALPLQIHEEVYRPSRGWPSSASHYWLVCRSCYFLL